MSHARLLTQVEALREFPRLRIPQRLYAFVSAGEVHAVRIGKRWFYPAWELEAVLRKPRNGGDPEYPEGISNNPYRRAA